METLGFLAAGVSAFVWGAYIVPFKKSGSSNLIQFQMLMTVGVFIFAVAATILLGYSLDLNIYGIVGGLMWATANAISLGAVKSLGMSRAMPMWISVVILTSFLWGAFVFQELSAGLLMGMLGIILIITGVVLIGTTGNTESENPRKGILLSIISGIIFGSQLVPLLLGNLSADTFFFPMSFGIFLFGVAYFIFKGQSFQKEAIGASLLSGGLWSLGNLLSIVAVSLIGLAKGVPITQGAVIFAVLWGVFYFKEVKKTSDIKKVLLGVFVLLSGVVILSLA